MYEVFILIPVSLTYSTLVSGTQYGDSTAILFWSLSQGERMLGRREERVGQENGSFLRGSQTLTFIQIAQKAHSNRVLGALLTIFFSFFVFF